MVNSNKLTKGWMKDYIEQSSTDLAANFEKFFDDVNKLHVLYNNIVTSATQISASCVKDQSFRRIFDNIRQSP